MASKKQTASEDRLDIADRRIAIAKGNLIARVIWAPSPIGLDLKEGERPFVHDEADVGWTLDKRDIMHAPPASTTVSVSVKA